MIGESVLIIIPAAYKQENDEQGRHKHLFAKPENYTPPTKNPDDCECGGGKPGATGRSLIANCPCCDGIQGLVEDFCTCDDSHYMKMRVTLPPNNTLRIRYIDTVEPIT